MMYSVYLEMFIYYIDLYRLRTRHNTVYTGTSDWVKSSHAWWESVPQRFSKQTMQSLLNDSSVVFPPIKNMYAKFAHKPDTVHAGKPGTSHDCIVHHYTVYHFLDMHCCTYCNKKVTSDLVASTLYISNIQKRSKMYRRGWGNKQNVRRPYAMSGEKWVYQLTKLVSPPSPAV